MKSKCILIVEDDKNISELVKLYAEKEGWRAVCAYDGKEGLHFAREVVADLIVLDWMLPEMDGIAILKELRKFSQTPVLFLTARAEEIDKILGFELGADDYLTKPFSPKELIARVKAIFRRTENKNSFTDVSVIEIGDLKIDPEKMEVQIDGKPLQLSAIEFKLLATMAANPGRVFTRENLMEKSHHRGDPVFDRTIDVHIKNLRKKLSDDPKNPKYIKSVFGVGYKFKEL